MGSGAVEGFRRLRDGAARDRTIVIYRLGSLGDTVVALPVFHLIERAFPHARRVLLTDAPVEARAAASELILGNSGLVDDIIEYPNSTRNPRELISLARRLRATKARTLIYAAEPRGAFQVRRDLVYFRLIGMTRIIGAPTRPDLLDRQIDPETDDLEQEAVRLARCFEPLGRIDLNDLAQWDLRLTPSEVDAATAFLAPLGEGPFLGIGVGGKALRNEWGDANWTRVLSETSRDYPEIGLVFIGAASEKERCAQLAGVWTGITLNGCGLLTPRQSAAVLERATLFIGHDSGPMHLAASRGTPCVCVFGDHNPPRVWHPHGPQHRIIHDMRGVMAIAPDQVLAAIRDILPARACSAARGTF
jgi:heptosyltransferase-3